MVAEADRLGFDKALIDRLIGDLRPDAIIHTAASYKDPENWVEDVRTNVLGTHALLEAIMPHPPGRLVAGRERIYLDRFWNEFSASPGRFSEAARQLRVTRQTLHRILAGRSAVTPEMAVRLGKFCGNGPALWLRMQQACDLWEAEQAMASQLAVIPSHLVA